VLPTHIYAPHTSMRQLIAVAHLLACATLSAAQDFLARATAERPLPRAGEGRYLDKGPGVCYFNGHAPVGQFLASVDRQACQDLCTADASCWGFSQDPASGACSLFQQGPLAGGGPAWGEASCSVKAPSHAEAAAAAAEPSEASGAASRAPAETEYEVAGGAGACTIGGRLPVAEAYPSVSAAACRSMCTARADCYGYDAAAGACSILTEGPLAGGCERKVQEPAPSASTLYEDAGAGACQWSGEEGQARLLPGLSASECAVRCTLVSDCQGFSSAADTCVIFSGAQVALGGTWGYARCERKAAGPGSAATLLP